MGAIQAAVALQQILLFAGATISAPLLPIIVNAVEEGSGSKGLERVNMLGTWTLSALFVVIFIGLPEVGVLVFGSEYGGQDFTVAFAILTVTASFMMYKQGVARLLAARGLIWWGALSNLVWAAVAITLTVCLADRGAVGYATAMLAAYLAAFLALIGFYVKLKLVPEGTILSLNAGYIWAVILALAMLSILGVGLMMRVAAVLVALLAIAYCFRLLLFTRDSAWTGR
jgi:hypothetical protein